MNILKLFSIIKNEIGYLKCTLICFQKIFYLANFSISNTTVQRLILTDQFKITKLLHIRNYECLLASACEKLVSKAPAASQQFALMKCLARNKLEIDFSYLFACASSVEKQLFGEQLTFFFICIPFIVFFRSASEYCKC